MRLVLCSVAAFHVTLKAEAPASFPLPRETEGFIVGVAEDGAGVQALVVEIGGTTRRPDGSTYHITLSLSEGRKAAESNDVIRERGRKAVSQRQRVRLEPRMLP